MRLERLALTGSLQRTAQSSLQACRGSGWIWATSYKAPVVVQARGDGDLDEAWTDMLWRLNQQDSRMNHVVGGQGEGGATVDSWGSDHSTGGDGEESVLAGQPASSLGKGLSTGLGFAQWLPLSLVVREGQRVHMGLSNLGFSIERLGSSIAFLVSRY